MAALQHAPKWAQGTGLQVIGAAYQMAGGAHWVWGAEKHAPVCGLQQVPVVVVGQGEVVQVPPKYVPAMVAHCAGVVMLQTFPRQHAPDWSQTAGQAWPSKKMPPAAWHWVGAAFVMHPPVGRQQAPMPDWAWAVSAGARAPAMRAHAERRRRRQQSVRNMDGLLVRGDRATRPKPGPSSCDGERGKR